MRRSRIALGGVAAVWVLAWVAGMAAQQVERPPLVLAHGVPLSTKTYVRVVTVRPDPIRITGEPFRIESDAGPLRLRGTHTYVANASASTMRVSLAAGVTIPLTLGRAPAFPPVVFRDNQNTVAPRSDAVLYVAGPAPFPGERASLLVVDDGRVTVETATAGPLALRRANKSGVRNARASWRIRVPARVPALAVGHKIDIRTEGDAPRRLYGALLLNGLPCQLFEAGSEQISLTVDEPECVPKQLPALLTVAAYERPVAATRGAQSSALMTANAPVGFVDFSAALQGALVRAGALGDFADSALMSAAVEVDTAHLSVAAAAAALANVNVQLQKLPAAAPAFIDQERAYHQLVRRTAAPYRTVFRVTGVALFLGLLGVLRRQWKDAREAEYRRRSDSLVGVAAVISAFLGGFALLDWVLGAGAF